MRVLKVVDKNLDVVNMENKEIDNSVHLYFMFCFFITKCYEFIS